MTFASNRSSTKPVLMAVQTLGTSGTGGRTHLILAWFDTNVSVMCHQNKYHASSGLWKQHTYIIVCSWYVSLLSCLVYLTTIYSLMWRFDDLCQVVKECADTDAHRQIQGYIPCSC